MGPALLPKTLTNEGTPGTHSHDSEYRIPAYCALGCFGQIRVGGHSEEELVQLLEARQAGILRNTGVTYNANYVIRNYRLYCNYDGLFCYLGKQLRKATQHPHSELSKTLIHDLRSLKQRNPKARRCTQETPPEPSGTIFFCRAPMNSIQGLVNKNLQKHVGL